MRTLHALVLALLAACSSSPRPAARAPVPPAAPAAAPGLDALTRDAWARAGVTPAPVADDATFLRRVTLDVAGRVPTVAEARAFLADTDPRKRERLVDRLLASPEHAEHFADVYSDLLFGRDARLRGPLARGPGRAYLVRAFAENRPWDVVATEILTATGDIADDGAVAYVGFHVAKGQDAGAAAGTTARLFLGLSIQCAQCHDHPYDERWTQRDFDAFAAYFAETRARRGKDDAGRPSLVVFDQPLPEALYADGPRGERARAKLTDRLAARGREVPGWALVRPRFLGRDVPPADGETRRQTLARAIVASPLFARVTVNRTWALFFGTAISDPWDDLGAEDEAPPPLLDRLASDFAASGHDHRALVRAIVLSDAYQRASSAPGGAEPAERVFARARVRPLSADQLFAALLTATGLEHAGRGRFRQDVERGKQQALRELLFVFPDDEMGESDGFSGSLAQALLFWNGELTNLGATAFEGTVLGEALAASDDPAARLDTLFLAAYARFPRAEERTRLLAWVAEQGGGRAAWEDLFFALLASSEFTTNH
jgi:hypothetical protein